MPSAGVAVFTLAVLLRDVLAEHAGRRTCNRPGEVEARPQLLRPPVVPGQCGEPLAHPAGGHAPLREIQPGGADFGWEVDQQVHMVGVAVEVGQLGLEVGADCPCDLFQRLKWASVNTACWYVIRENRVGM